MRPQAGGDGAVGFERGAGDRVDAVGADDDRRAPDPAVAQHHDRILRVADRIDRGSRLDVGEVPDAVEQGGVQVGTTHGEVRGAVPCSAPVEGRSGEQPTIAVTDLLGLDRDRAR